MSRDDYQGWEEPRGRRHRSRHGQDADYDQPAPGGPAGRDPRDWAEEPGYRDPAGYQDPAGYDDAGYAAPDGYGSWAAEPDRYGRTDPRDARTDPRAARTDPHTSRPDYTSHPDYGQDLYPGRGDYPAEAGYPGREPYRDPRDHGAPGSGDTGWFRADAAPGAPGYASPDDYPGADRYDDRNSYPDQAGYESPAAYNGQGGYGGAAGYGAPDDYQQPGGYDTASYRGEPGYQPGGAGYDQPDGYGEYDSYGRPARSGPLQAYPAGSVYGPAGGVTRYQQDDVGRDGPRGGGRGPVQGMDADDDRHSGFFSGFISNDDDHYGKASRRGRGGGGKARGGRRGGRGGRGRGRAAGVLATLVIFAVIAGIGGGLYYGYRWYHGRHASYTGTGYGKVIVTVQPGDSALSIAPQLQRLGVILSQQPFVTAASQSTSPRGLQPGEFKLHLHMGPAQAWAMLLDPKSRVSVRVTVIDGLRWSKILPLLAKESGIPLTQFQSAIKDTAALGLPSYAHGNPEGYLWPATYDVAPGETALQILKATVHQFNLEASTLNLAAGARQTGFTEAHLVIIASLLEAEVGPQYYAKVARVIDNRLKAGMTLGLDSTVAYAVDKYTYNLTASDLATNSPYNTRKYPGLPPGPIDSPGAAAIQAAMHPAPASNGWLYFVTVNKSGLTLFTSDPNQFQTWVHQAKSNGL